MVGLVAALGFFPAVVSGGYSLAVVRGGLIVVASLVLVHGLSYSSARGVFLDQGLHRCLSHCKVDS